MRDEGRRQSETEKWDRPIPGCVIALAAPAGDWWPFRDSLKSLMKCIK